MAWLWLGIAAQWIISWTCAMLVTFVSGVGQNYNWFVLKVLWTLLTSLKEITDTLCHIIPPTVSNTFK